MDFVIKPDPALDFYILWSTIVDAPVLWGSRTKMLAVDKYYNIHNERLDRTDERGTSSLGDPPWYGWDHEKFVFEGYGLIKRSDLVELCKRMEEHRPFDDLIEVVEDADQA